MSESEAKSGGSDATRISDVEKWLAARFGDAGKEVPDFEYTPRSVSYLHNLITISEAKEKSADIVAKDFRRKAAEYRSQGQPLPLSLSLSLLALMLRIVNYHFSPLSLNFAILAINFEILLLLLFFATNNYMFITVQISYWELQVPKWMLHLKTAYLFC